MKKAGAALVKTITSVFIGPMPHLGDLKETTKILRDSHCVRCDQFRADDGK